MSEVKRFDHVNHAHVDDCEHIENPEGAWVKASDYDALAAKLAMAEDAAAKGDAARQQCGGMEMEIEDLRAELATLRARVVVTPDASTVYAALDARERLFTSPENIQVALEAQSRLNGKTVSEGLLRQLLDSDGIDGIFDAQQNYAAHQELRALLNQDTENGDHAA